MPHLSLSPRAAVLLEPVWDMLTSVTQQAQIDANLTVEVGEVEEGFYSLEGRVLTLDSNLEGPDWVHPLDRSSAGPSVDRWRRAASSVLEALFLLRLFPDSVNPYEANWIQAGVVLDAVDSLCPDWNIAAPDLATAIETGDLHTHPRAGVAVMKAWRNAGENPCERALACHNGSPLALREWMSVGQWVFKSDGLRSLLPMVVEPVAPKDIPLKVGPWSWARIQVPAHRRGGRVGMKGRGGISNGWAPAEKVLEALAVSQQETLELFALSGGPDGTWSLTSAEGFGQVYGARGLSFRFRTSGMVELTFADAFFGPVAAFEVADTVGTSGVATGRWRVAGKRELEFRDLKAHNMTVHGRSGETFAVPMGEIGYGAIVQGMQENRWSWKVAGETMRLKGTIMGGEVELHLRKE